MALQAILRADSPTQVLKMRRRYRPYDPREDGPLYRYTNRRPGYRRTVTVPERGVGTHVRLVFAELARQSASGVRRASVKAWRSKNKPGLDSLEAALNALGWHFIAVPAHVEMLPPILASKVAEVAALAKIELGEVWSAAVQIAALQLASTAEGERTLAELDAAHAALRDANEKRRYRRRNPANDNTKQAESAA